jgi:hypothetical protein
MLNSKTILAFKLVFVPGNSREIAQISRLKREIPGIPGNFPGIPGIPGLFIPSRFPGIFLPGNMETLIQTIITFNLVAAINQYKAANVKPGNTIHNSPIILIKTEVHHLSS